MAWDRRRFTFSGGSAVRERRIVGNSTVQQHVGMEEWKGRVDHVTRNVELQAEWLMHSDACCVLRGLDKIFFSSSFLSSFASVIGDLQ